MHHAGHSNRIDRGLQNSTLTSVSPPAGKRFGWACCCILLLVSGSGCATGRIFTPQNLPAELRAQRNSNVRTVDLTRLASATVPNDEIAPGDVLQVNVAAGLSPQGVQDFALRVTDQGEIELPDAGRVYVGGLSLQDAEGVIKTAFVNRQVYRNPHVTVTMKQRREYDVTVVGAVKQQGTFKLRAGSAGVLHAISMAGGFAPDAGTIVEVKLPGESPAMPDTKEPAIASGSSNGHALVEHRVPVRTSGPRQFKIDLASLSSTDSSSLQLGDGAVVMVEQRDPQPIAVQGLVRKPDIYEYPVAKNLYVLDALAMAGGESSLVADKVYVIRRRPNEPEPAVIQVSIAKAKRDGRENLLLEPGDTVSVEQTPATVVLETIRVIGFGLTGRVF